MFVGLLWSWHGFPFLCSCFNNADFFECHVSLPAALMATCQRYKESRQSRPVTHLLRDIATGVFRSFKEVQGLIFYIEYYERQDIQAK